MARNKMVKFRGKYRTASARLQNWDYGWNASYFVTVCTKNKESYLGHVVDGDMQLSSIGILADVFWHEIKNHTKDVELVAFVVMPNHVHGILVLNGNDNNGGDYGEGNRDDDDAGDGVETRRALSLRPPRSRSQGHQQQSSQTIGRQRFQNQGRNTISSIIGSYKSAVTKHAHRLRFDFAWQPRFYDHIIRDEKSYNTIVEYITNNPKKWNDDRFYVPC